MRENNFEKVVQSLFCGFYKHLLFMNKQFTPVVYSLSIHVWTLF